MVNYAEDTGGLHRQRKQWGWATKAEDTVGVGYIDRRLEQKYLQAAVTGRLNLGSRRPS
jgi:hypothetical protein